MLQKAAYDTVSNQVLTAHNVWMYVRSFLEEKELAFMQASEADKAAPQKLIDMRVYIKEIIGEELWHAKLKREKLLLVNAFSKKTLKDVVEEDGLL